MALGFRPLHATFGAEVTGADLSGDVDAATLAELETAWKRYSILLFRDVEMSPVQHIAFTRRLGPLHIMEPLEFNLPGHPEVMVVLLSTYLVEDLPPDVRSSGAAAYLHKGDLSGRVLRRLWDDGGDPEFKRPST